MLLERRATVTVFEMTAIEFDMNPLIHVNLCKSRNRL